MNILHKSVQENSEVSPKYLRPKSEMIQKLCVTDRQGQKNRLSSFKFDAQFYFGTFNNFEKTFFIVKCCNTYF